MVEEKQHQHLVPDLTQDQAEIQARNQDWWSLTRKSSILITKNLILRKLQQIDAKPIAKLANNVRVSSMTARLPHPYSVGDAVDFINQAGSSQSSSPSSKL